MIIIHTWAMFETRAEIRRAARERRAELAEQFRREERMEALIAKIERRGIEIPNKVLDVVMKADLGPQYSRGPWHRFNRAVMKWFYEL